MKKAIIAVVGVVALLAAGSAYAHMYGWGGGPGYGGHMWGGGPGYMWGGYADEDAKKFLEETADVRRDLHEKRFELREAYRTGDKAKVEALEKEIDGLYDKLAEKGGFERGPRRGFGRGFGPRAGYGPGYFCGGPYGR